MGALMALDGGSWLQAWPGPGTQAAPAGRKSPWAPGGLAPPLPESHFCLFLMCSAFLQTRTDDLAPGLRAGVRPWSSLHAPGLGIGR
jgi:hypothetical protein